VFPEIGGDQFVGERQILVGEDFFGKPQIKSLIFIKRRHERLPSSSRTHPAGSPRNAARFTR